MNNSFSHLRLLNQKDLIYVSGQGLNDVVKAILLLFLYLSTCFSNKLLEFIIQHQHKSTAHSSEYIGESPFEECFATLVASYLLPAVNGSCVHNVRWKVKMQRVRLK